MTELETKFNEWIKTKAPNFKLCPVCGHNSWSMDDDIRHLQVGTDWLAAGVGLKIPAVVIACNNCGYLMFFSATLAGLVDIPK